MSDYCFCPILEARACRSLWQAVLLMAIKDAMSLPSQEQREAKVWILNARARFRLVCEGAGFDPDMIHEQFKAISEKKGIKIGRRI